MSGAVTMLKSIGDCCWPAQVDHAVPFNANCGQLWGPRSAVLLYSNGAAIAKPAVKTMTTTTDAQAHESKGFRQHRGGETTGVKRAAA